MTDPALLEAVRRGRLALNTGDLSIAQKEFAAAITLAPENSSVYLWAAEAESRLSQHIKALALTDKALSFATDVNNRGAALQMRISLLLHTKQFKKAEETARDAIRNQPDNAINHIFLATALYKRKKFTAAEAEFKEALTRAPGTVIPLIPYASFLKSRHRLTEALAVTEKAAKLQPDDEDIMIQRGFIAYQLDKLDVAYDMAIWVLSRQANHKQGQKLLAYVKSRQSWLTAPYWIINSAYARSPKVMATLFIIGGGGIGLAQSLLTHATPLQLQNSRLIGYAIFFGFALYGVACVGHVNSLVKKEQKLIKLRRDY